MRVRRALAHAIDRDFVVKTIFLGYAKPATGPVPAYDKTFYTDQVPHYDFDPAKAEALLDEAGYPKGADGIRFKLRLLPAPFFNETKQFGDYLRQALAAIGIDAEIVSNDTPAHLKAVYTDHAFDITVATPVYRGDPAISTTILYPERVAGRRALLQPVRLCEPRGGRADRQGRRDDRRRGAGEPLQGVPGGGRRGRGADQRGRVQLHQRRQRQGAERLQQSALGGLVVGRHVGARLRRAPSHAPRAAGRAPPSIGAKACGARSFFSAAADRRSSRS